MSDAESKLISSESKSTRKSFTQLIDQSELSDVVKNLIRNVVKRTRLWKREKSQVALELIAHFKDGIDAGRSADQLISDFGDIKTTAKLMRRAKKRNRPLWWRVQRRLSQGFVLFVLAYAGLALLLSTRHPNPTIDYVAELNKPILATAEADRAWPIYRAAWLSEKDWPLSNNEFYHRNDDDSGRFARPTDAEWAKGIAFLNAHQSLINALREGGLKPSSGFSLQFEVSDEDWLAMTGRKNQSAPRTQNLPKAPVVHSLISALLPFLSPMRHSASLLADDMRVAGQQNDSARMLSDYRALIGMARQCRETPFLVNQLVSIGIFLLADHSLIEVCHTSPKSLSNVQADLLHFMAGSDALTVADLEAEHDIFRDMIQRTYSDNGHGDGSPTIDGLNGFISLEPAGAIDHPPDWLSSIGLPLATVALASRKELTERSDAFYSLVAEDGKRPLWVQLRSPGKADAMILAIRNSSTLNFHYALLTILAPSFAHTNEVFGEARAVHEAAMVAIALDAYHEKNGKYPDTLSELVPHFYPTQPIDYSTGGPLQYKLVNNAPLLYGLGLNDKDDGGVWTPGHTRWPRIPTAGDWVLYPPPESE